MLGWVGDIEQETLDNTTFRTVVFTGEHTQLTVMRLAPGEDIGREAHDDRDQFCGSSKGWRGSSSGALPTRSTRRTRRPRTGRSSCPPGSGTTSSTPGTAT
jgi:hypothetical protein